MRKVPDGFLTSIADMSTDMLEGAVMVLNMLKDYGLQPEDATAALLEQVRQNDNEYEARIDEVLRGIGPCDDWALDNFVAKVACNQGEEVNKSDVRYQIGWLLGKGVAANAIYNYLKVNGE